MLFDQIASNKRKTWILLLVFFLLLALVGYAVGYLFMRSGLGGLVIALIIGFIYALSMIFQSTEIVMSMNGAREVDEQTAPDLYHVVEDMAMVAQIPMPRVFIIDDPALNAFATGSNPQNAAVAATSGLMLYVSWTIASRCITMLMMPAVHFISMIPRKVEGSKNSFIPTHLSQNGLNV